MLSFRELVQAVHDAALNAADAVRAKNLDIIGDFFEPASDQDESTAIAIAALDAAAEGMEPGPGLDGIRHARDRLGAGSGGSDAETPAGVGPPLRPKMVAISYPKETKGGEESHLVYVPLIALTPVAIASLSNLTFRTDLELSQAESGDLKISFPSRPSTSHVKSGNDDEARGSPATLEISLDATAPSQGLQKLIEGYERALRAQIPG